jgi:hypothetical protein
MIWQHTVTVTFSLGECLVFGMGFFFVSFLAGIWTWGYYIGAWTPKRRRRAVMPVTLNGKETIDELARRCRDEVRPTLKVAPRSDLNRALDALPMGYDGRGGDEKEST